MSVTFSAAPGIVASLNINGVNLACDFWDFDESMNLIDVPAFTGGRYMEIAAGKTRCFFQATGVWDFNRNLNTTIKPGQGVAIILRISDVVIASNPRVIVERFHVFCAADGTTRYEAYFQSDYSFFDFTNTAG